MGRCRPVSDSEADAMEAKCHNPQELALLRFFRHTAYLITRNQFAGRLGLMGWPPGQRPRTNPGEAYEEESVPPADSHCSPAQAGPGVLADAICSNQGC